MRKVRRRTAALVAASVVVFVGAAGAATSVSGSVAGAITAATGSTFTIATTVTSTGSSTVKLSSKTAITKQVAGTRANLKKGDCVRASAAQVVITACSAGGFGGRNQLGQGGGGGAAGFTPGGNGGFAFGTISALNGSRLTVTGRFGATSVVLSSKTTILKTVPATAAAIAVKECAFVRGSSSDNGVTVVASNVALTQPTTAGCARPGRP